MIETVRRLWHCVPDWRLGQLVCNISRMNGDWDPFFTEDDKFDDCARRMLYDLSENGEQGCK